MEIKTISHCRNIYQNSIRKNVERGKNDTINTNK